MKNLILIILFIFSVNKLNAQDTFVKKYTSFVTKDDKGISDWKTVSLTVVYNEKVKVEDILKAIKTTSYEGVEISTKSNED